VNHVRGVPITVLVWILGHQHQHLKSLPVGTKNLINHDFYFSKSFVLKSFVNFALFWNYLEDKIYPYFISNYGVEGCAGAMIIRGDLSKGIRDLTFRYPRYSQIFVNLFQMSIGFVSNLIVFPPIILIIYLFKKSKPLKKRINRLDVGLEQGKPSLIMTSQYSSILTKRVHLNSDGYPDYDIGDLAL